MLSLFSLRQLMARRKAVSLMTMSPMTVVLAADGHQVAVVLA